MDFNAYMIDQLKDPEMAVMYILDAYNTITEDGGLDLLLRRIEQLREANETEVEGRNRELPAAIL